jgi:hypothetical protein
MVSNFKTAAAIMAVLFTAAGTVSAQESILAEVRKVLLKK